ncbi:MAG TPA: cupin domain-containing protein [Stellaceae bacterium]|nr:cupin domain-containing protein [Stellaceae bacterium]
MELNADFSKRAVVHAARVSWVPSPIAGVERRMLDRIGEEVSRATSIVRYASNSRFSAHTHGGGEEFIVLDGVFSDEHGDFPAGSYIRNPPGSRHTPGSEKGCIIFVKLWQFDPEDRKHVRIDATKRPFLPTRDRPGVEVLLLHEDARENVRLERWSADTQIFLRATGGAEILVLEGGFSDGDETFEPQSWLRLPVDAMLTARPGANGCKVWVKTGHLARPQTAPRL